MPDPLAFFITWTTYGSWLPGDERGWVYRGKGFQLSDPIRKSAAEMLMTEDVCVLDEEQRRLVEETIVNHCRIRAWELRAVNCRTNHCHVVVSANRDPDEVREQFKAWGTRKLKELEQARQKKSETAAKVIRKNWWTERRSVRYIGDEASLEAAIRYVLDGQ